MKKTGRLIIVRHDNFFSEISNDAAMQTVQSIMSKLSNAAKNGQSIVILSVSPDTQSSATAFGRLANIKTVSYKKSNKSNLGGILDIINHYQGIEVVVLIIDPPETMAVLEYFSATVTNYNLKTPYANYLSSWNPTDIGMWLIDFDNNKMSLI